MPDINIGMETRLTLEKDAKLTIESIDGRIVITITTTSPSAAEGRQTKVVQVMETK